MNSPPPRSDLAAAAELLRNGELVAFPTETVYGLGANAMDARAAQNIFAAKQRPADNPLIVHVAGIEQVTRVARELTPLAKELLARWAPGPLTVVLDARDDVPRATTGGLDTVAVRIPDHPLALALITEAGIPLAGPSANRSGRPSPTTADHVADDLCSHVAAIVDGGPCQVGVESTVVDARGLVPVVLREGAVTREDLGLDGLAEGVSPADLGASPGTRYRHYAPDCRITIAPPGKGDATAAAFAAEGRRTGLLAPSPAPPGVHSLAQPVDAKALGQVLYDALRASDAARLEVLVIEAVADQGLGRAVMDRIRRAAGVMI